MEHILNIYYHSAVVLPLHENQHHLPQLSDDHLIHLHLVITQSVFSQSQ